jgi:hypothetical protein
MAAKTEPMRAGMWAATTDVKMAAPMVVQRDMPRAAPRGCSMADHLAGN